MTEEAKTANFNKFQEYKLFVEDTARFSDRRQMASNVMVAVNALLVAGVGTLVAKAADGAWWLLLVAALLLVAGILVCVIWFALIRRYEEMIKLRVGELKQMECLMDGSHEWHHLMEELYKKGLSFSGIQQWLPCVFIGLYLAFIVAGAYLLGHSQCGWHPWVGG